MTLAPQVQADILAALSGMETWEPADDACDCVFMRVGYWQNPYLGFRHEVRLCCVWAELRKMWPQFFRDHHAEQVPWNGATDMPAYLWYRQTALREGRPVGEVRAQDSLRLAEKPKGKPRPVVRRKRSWWSRWL